MLRRTFVPRISFVFVRCTYALVFALLGLGSPAAVYAAGGQTGNVARQAVDAATRAPIANVTVRAVAPSGTYSGRTDARGAFTFIGLTIDTYTLSTAIDGYEAAVTQGVTVQGDQ